MQVFLTMNNLHGFEDPESRSLAFRPSTDTHTGAITDQCKARLVVESTNHLGLGDGNGHALRIDSDFWSCPQKRHKRGSHSKQVPVPEASLSVTFFVTSLIAVFVWETPILLASVLQQPNNDLVGLDLRLRHKNWPFT